MKRVKAGTAQTRVFLRAAVRNAIEDQEERARALAGDDEVVIFRAHERDDWFTLARPGDTLIVDRLELIPPLRSKECPRPAVDLADVLAEIGRRRLRLIDSASGLDNCSEKWRMRVREATKNVMTGRRLGTAKARELGKRRGAQKSRESVVNYWKQHPERAMFVAIWRGAKGNSEMAREAVNIAASKLHYPILGSVSACNRAFGHRAKRKPARG